jgi:hypothetical protein
MGLSSKEKNCKISHKPWYPPSRIVSNASLDKRAGRTSKQTYSTEDEDKNVPWPISKRQKLHMELPSVMWALRPNINRASRDTPFNLVYGVDIVLPPEIYLESVRVAHFNEENQSEARELDSNLLKEKHNTALANV